MNDPLKKYRRQFRAWRNSIRLKRELKYYHSAFEARGLSVPDEASIKQAMRLRFPNLKSKPKENLNILAIYHHYNWENESLKPSLEKFGFVLHYDWFEAFNHQWKDWHQTVKSEMNKALESQAEQSIREYSIDVIFAYIPGEILEPDIARKISSFDVPMINMSLNDKEAFVGKIRNGQAMGSRDICRYFDICWTSTEDAVKKYCVEGALPIYLPEGANPEIHRPYDVEKTIDVSFVGQSYGNRPEIIQNLKLKGFNIEAFGYGWPNGSLSTEEMIRMYSRSKINLGFGGVSGHKETYCLKGRDFEIPMSGGLYLTEYHPELEGYYELGKEIVTYTDFDDLVTKIRYLLSNSKQADEIRDRGTQRARNDHTWEMRFEKVFSLLGLI